MLENYFDEDVAATYDLEHGGQDGPMLAACVDRLEALSAGAPALEFAIGTGRVALPLAARGVAVSGIELSHAMVDVLRAKPGGGQIPVTMGDMCATRVPGAFGLVYLVFNTINNLTTQAAQAACVQNAAKHLAPGGRFVIEVQVPPLQDLPRGATHRSFALSETHWGIDAFDLTTQAFTSHHVWMEHDRVRRLSIPMRYVWPSELDLMAAQAGLRPEHRWADWTQAPFCADSRAHVSVWRKA